MRDSTKKHLKTAGAAVVGGGVGGLAGLVQKASNDLDVVWVEAEHMAEGLVHAASQGHSFEDASHPLNIAYGGDPDVLEKAESLFAHAQTEGISTLAEGKRKTNRLVNELTVAITEYGIEHKTPIIHEAGTFAHLMSEHPGPVLTGCVAIGTLAGVAVASVAGHHTQKASEKHPGEPIR